MALPIDAAKRKAIPLCNGVLDYFPDALAAVAEVSMIGNEQHNPGQPLHWSREKSFDHPNTVLRHMVERGTLDIDTARHSAKLAWRALANLQVEIMAERGDELAIYQVIHIGTDEQKARLKTLQPDKYAVAEKRVIDEAAAKKNL